MVTVTDVITSIRNALPVENSRDASRMVTYRCEDCGATQESAKDPDRVRCMECLSHDTTRIEET